MNSKIKYYPTGNGDMSLITLEDSTTILIDCNIRETSQGDDDKTKYDVKDDLLTEVKKRNNNPFVDVFILTHGDQDHCRGFKNNFYQGDPKNYKDKNRNENEIIIDELWFSPMIAEEATNPDEDVIQAEAERRLKLHREKDVNRNEPGNRIFIIGYDGPNKKYTDLDHLRQVPGSIITKVNYKEQEKFSIFIHAPFKEQFASAEGDKNTTSIVFQARFKNLASDSEFSCLAIFGGDSDHYSWKVILEKTEKKKNHELQKALDWDLFLAPHHCSWSFFNDTPQSDYPKPQEHSLRILDYKRANAIVIASCKKINDDDSNPPHYQAKQQYAKKVGAEKFLNTETENIKGETPQPIEFVVTANGPAKSPGKVKSSSLSSAGGIGAASIVIKHG